MIRFAICSVADATIQKRVDGEIVDVIQPAGTILRSGYCSPAIFNRQALGPNEAAIEIAAEDYPPNDVTHFIDLSGPEPVLALKPEE